jgi:hypothetical protein
MHFRPIYPSPLEPQSFQGSGRTSAPAHRAPSRPTPPRAPALPGDPTPRRRAPRVRPPRAARRRGRMALPDGVKARGGGSVESGSPRGLMKVVLWSARPGTARRTQCHQDRSSPTAFRGLERSSLGVPRFGADQPLARVHWRTYHMARMSRSSSELGDGCMSNVISKAGSP